MSASSVANWTPCERSLTVSPSGQAAKRLIAFVSGSDFKLVETLAHRAAMMILEEFSVEWVRLSVNKPGAIRHSKDVGVAVLRTRAHLSDDFKK